MEISTLLPACLMWGYMAFQARRKHLKGGKANKV